jgi:hypothetical protein
MMRKDNERQLIDARIICKEEGNKENMKLLKEDRNRKRETDKQELYVNLKRIKLETLKEVLQDSEEQEEKREMSIRDRRIREKRDKREMRKRAQRH